VVFYLPKGGLPLILGERLGGLVVDAEEEGGDGVLLADGTEDSDNKGDDVWRKKEAHLRSLQRAGKPVKGAHCPSVRF
jgi:hypothetical protein